MQNLEKNKIIIKDTKIAVMKVNGVEYVSLTDIARLKNEIYPNEVVKKWMSNNDSFEFYSLWEELFNKDFNSAEFGRIKISEAYKKSFVMTPNQWKRRTNATGIIPSSGKYSVGTFAHPDIALEFASWIDVSFKLHLIKEFQRLKELENKEMEWSAKRELAKVNYHIHTNAIKENLIIPTLTKEQIYFTYASEADLLNVALFGITASEWKRNNKEIKGNMRDYASIEQLLVLANMESYNSTLIEEGLSQQVRIIKLNDMARNQIKVLQRNNVKILENKVKY